MNNTTTSITFKNEHITIPAAIIQQIVQSDTVTHVRAVFYAKDRTYLIAAENDDLFTSLHKTHKVLLKDKNIHGDKSICIQPLIIDFELNIHNPNINYNIEPNLRILTLYF